MANSRNTDCFRVSNKTRLKAIKRMEAENEIFFKENSGFVFGVSVEFKCDLPNIKNVYRREDSIIAYEYNREHIEKNNSPADLFSNFKFLFNFVDIDDRISLISKNSEMQSIEKIIGVKSHNHYKEGIAFKEKFKAAIAQIAGYEHILHSIGITVEGVLKSIYTEYFPNILGYSKNAHFLEPSTSISHLEKIRLLAPELESILKQYSHFVKEGEIDLDLLTLSSNATTVDSVPSLLNNKYAYRNESSDIISSIFSLLFSDQSMLTFIEPFREKNYRSFLDLLANETVLIDYFDNWDKSSVEFLVNHDILEIDNSGHIRIYNVDRVVILKELYYNEFISVYHWPIQTIDEIYAMAELDLIYFGSTLLSRQEQAYLNYYLNKREFTNGLDLRNKYLHGTQPRLSEEGAHQTAYFTYLILIVLLVIKIGSDLALYKHLTNYIGKTRM